VKLLLLLIGGVVYFSAFHVGVVNLGGGVATFLVHPAYGRVHRPFPSVAEVIHFSMGPVRCRPIAAARA